MKLDRRSFLGFGLGTVAGVAVSPIGIKLTDDSSIWTQNWPWIPVPADGEVIYENSVCSLCPGSCGIRVRKIDSRPVKIEGLAGYPVNDGGACLYGISGLQYVYDPSRIKKPLKKKGDTFREISWDDAISIVSGKLNDIRKSGSPEKLACLSGSDKGSVSGLFQRFLITFGSPNFYTMPGYDANLDVTAAAIHGKGMTIGFDLENADFILSFGAGVIEGWGSPVHCIKANASRKDRHAKLYQIEPRLSNTAANADKWIPIKPGTEADLALGLCAAILKHKRFDSSTAMKFKGGVHTFAANLEKEYTLSKTAGITGVNASDIEKLAERFAKAKMPLAVFGKGRGDGAQSLKEMTAVHTLNCLVGNINKKGGAFVQKKAHYLNFPDPFLDTLAQKSSAMPKTGRYIQQLFERVNRATRPAIEALFVYDANPCYTLHNPKMAREALKKIPFVVSFSSFLDETAKEADIILPSHTFIEQLGDVPPKGGLSKTVVGLARPVIDPVFDTRHPGDSVLMIAKSLETSVADNFEWESYEECLESVTSKIWNSLSEEGYAIISEGSPPFSVTMNVSFLSSNPATVQARGNYDLTLIPIDNIKLLSSATPASPFAMKTVSDKVIKGRDIVVEINPLTAKGLKDCGYATLTTPMGSAKVRIHFNEGIMPGVIGMAEGLGHLTDNKYVSGKGVNINDLIGPVIEPGSGLDAAFGIKAKISRV